MSSPISNSGFFAQTGRHAKAQKIIKILEDQGKIRNSSLRLLDIGTGNGEIAFYLSQYYDVTSVDVIAPIGNYDDKFSFFRISDENLPFADNSFDVIVSNHVIEHLKNQDLHLAEMARTLKPDGLAYLATPNRFWPWEVHYHMGLLHYLPQPLFMFLLKIIKRYREDIWLLSWPSLKHKAKKHFSVAVVSDAVCKWPRRYYLNTHPKVAAILSWVPRWLYRAFTFIHPTLIVILTPK